jgi:protein-L-isoaspartate(D-aspartate) O-methyltransferase
MLTEMLQRRIEYHATAPDRYLDVVQNARVVANAEHYYRIMYYGGAESWNLRDQHMFDTLETLLAFRGDESKAVVWAHNSHIGDARATEMSARGEHNLGQLVRTAYSRTSFAIGFGTDHGLVAAADNWGGPMQCKPVRPSMIGSYERLFHDSEMPAFFLPLREPRRPELRDELREPRLERAIGVIYRPETELASHYFHAVLPLQFDEYIWFDRTEAVTPLDEPSPHGVPDTFPFGV